MVGYFSVKSHGFISFLNYLFNMVIESRTCIKYYTEILLDWTLLNRNVFKNKGGWHAFVVFWQKTTSCVYFVESILKPTLHWFSHLLIVSGSLVISLAEVMYSWECRDFVSKQFVIWRYSWLETIRVCEK